MTIDRRQVEIIVEKVLEGLSSTGQNSSANSFSPEGSGGVFQEMEGAIQAAANAQQALVRLPLSTREKIIQTLRDVGWSNREEYGRMELEETDLGAVNGTVLKLEVACGVPGMEDLASEVYMGDRGVTINERLPVGVIASINAITNAAPGIIHTAS